MISSNERPGGSRFKLSTLIGVWVAATATVAIAGANLCAAERPRLLVLTDIGGDPDDQQSMIRLMLYSNEFDIEGLVASASGTPGELRRAVTRPDLIQEIVLAYGQVRPRLLEPTDGWPEAGSLLSRIKTGNPQRGRGHIGEGHDTEGSRWIIERIDAGTAGRPLNIAIWGGQTDLAQALWRVRADRGTDGLAAFVKRFRVYDIADQDGIAEWMWSEFPGMFYILSRAAKGRDKREAVFRGMYLTGDESLTSREWVDRHVRSSGPLGALYPIKTWTAPNRHGCLKEGDTPSWFFFLARGGNDPADPTQPGWGGQYRRSPEGCYRDDRTTGNDPRESVSRWRPTFQQDFARRMSWCREPSHLAWEPVDIPLVAAEDHPWWTFPVSAEFTHEDGNGRMKLEGFWDGNRRWVIRFAPPRPGVWSYTTSSEDTGLDGIRGELRVRAPSRREIGENPNRRGQIRIAGNGRFFEYADGTPCFLLADTLWAANTARCGLGESEDGPFFQYLADRRDKGFTAILMQYFHGYGDYPDSPGHRNEGGKPFVGPPADQLNPAHFQALDVRMRALWERGFVAAIPTTWWGKTRRCSFSIHDARRISAYCAARYGAFNALWALSGEYQYCFRDCDWTPLQISQLGEVVQQHNPYRHPVSIHPSGRTDWPPPHNCQSSRPFHDTDWLDHHWLQTGQSADRMHNIVSRAAENRRLVPTRPVFCSEAYYEHAGDAEGAYHARWQAWVAFLNGCAGYGYGAQGMWQFYDPNDPRRETGKETGRAAPWQEALGFQGSTMVPYVAKLLPRYDWWELEPCREALTVDDRPCPAPTATDIGPPQCAVIPDRLCVVYIPRENQHRRIEVSGLPGEPERMVWFDPRTGKQREDGDESCRGDTGAWTIPERPEPASEDWVWLLELGE